MATFTEKLALIITADAQGAVAGLDATGAAATKNLTPIEAQARTATAGTLALGAAGVLIGGAIVGGLGKANDAYVSLGNQTRQIARLTGDTAQDASGLIYIAAKSGVSFESLNTGITRLSKNGAKLSDIGVSLTDATGKTRPFVSVLSDVADYFQNAPAGIDKTAEAVNLFGRGGTAMLPILNRGSAGIKELDDEAKSLGLTLSQGDLNGVAKYNAAQRDLQQASKATGVAIGKAIDPAETVVLKGIADAVGLVARGLNDLPDGAKTLLAVGVGVVGVGAAVGGAVALISFGVGKAAGGLATLGDLLSSVGQRLGITSAATDDLTASNLAAADSANDLALAEDKVGLSGASAATGEGVASTGAVTEGAAAGAGAAGAGSAGLLGGGVAAGALSVAVAAEVGSELNNVILSVQDRLNEAYTHLSADAKKGGTKVVQDFLDAANAQSQKRSVGDYLKAGVLGAIGIHQTPTVNLDTSFKSVLASQGTDQAQAIVDSFKKMNDGLDHNSDTYKANEAEVRKWQKAIDAAKASQDALTGSTKAGTVAVDAFGLEVQKGKDPVTSFATSLASEAGSFESVIGAESGVQNANTAVDQAKTQLAKDQLGNNNLADPTTAAAQESAASDSVASSNRAETAAVRGLAGANRSLAEARVAAAHDPTDSSKADALTEAEDRQKSATDSLAGSQDAAASSQRSLDDARLASLTIADQVANANDQIAASIRSVGEAQRSLSEAQTTLTRDEAVLAHTSQAKDPRAFQTASDKVQQDRDAVANAQDSVANARDQSAASVRAKTLLGATNTANQADKVAADKTALSQAQTAAAQAAIGLVVAEAQLSAVVKADPHALPALLAEVQQLADKGIIPQSTATEFENQLKYAAGGAKNLGDALTVSSAAFGALQAFSAGQASKASTVANSFFGGRGTPASNSGPSLFPTWGPGRAFGGPTERGVLHPVAEHGSELLHENGATYLLASKYGVVTPHHELPQADPTRALGPGITPAITALVNSPAANPVTAPALALLGAGRPREAVSVPSAPQWSPTPETDSSGSLGSKDVVDQLERIREVMKNGLSGETHEHTHVHYGPGTGPGTAPTVADTARAVRRGKWLSS